MTFFYDMNKKLQQVLETPKSEHMQLNERGEKWIQGAVDPSHKGDLHKALHVPQGEKIPKSKINKATHSKDAHLRHMAQFAKNVAPKQEGVMDTVKSVGKKVASGVNKLVGHGSDEEMRKDLQRKAGAPVTGKKPTFADKIAGAKKEVDEMLGDVAAEAIKSALSPKQKKLDKNNNGKLDAQDFAMLRAGAKKNQSDEMDESSAFDYKSPRKDAPKVGSVERGHKHDIKHTATGRVVTRRTDDQGHSVGADDDSDTDSAPRGRGRPKGTKNVSSKAKVFQRKSKLMTKEGDHEDDDLKAAMSLLKKAGYKVTKAEGSEELEEKAVSKAQQKFMGMVHAAQKGEKPASKEVAKVAKTMKKKDAEDFASTKHKGLPEKVKSKKKKEEEVEEGSSGATSSGSVATSTGGGKGGVFGKGIYDSFNRELENMISEGMSINMSDSTEGGKSLTVTATDEDAMQLAEILKSAGLGGGHDHAVGHDEHSEPCPTCGMDDCGCDDQMVDEANVEVTHNEPEWPTNTETSHDALQYAGGLNKPKTDVAGDGQTTVPNTAVHSEEEELLRRLKEMAGIQEAKKPDYLDFDKDGDKKEPMTKALKDKEKKVEESILDLSHLWKAYKG